MFQNAGKTGTDVVTGFTGVIISRVEYLTGCAQYGIQPSINKDGVVPDVRYVDEGRVDITDDFIIDVASVQSDQPGGERTDHP